MGAEKVGFGAENCAPLQKKLALVQKKVGLVHKFCEPFGST